MARKSRELRLSQAREAYNLWTEAGFGNDRSALFLRDMIAKLDRSKSLSAGQRKYLDGLIESGTPITHNKERLEVIDEAIGIAGMELMHQPLSDFRFKLSKGWKLSEKQEAFLTNLLGQAETLKSGMLPLNEKDAWLVEQLIAYGYGRGDYYWQHRPGHYRSWQNAMHFYETHGTVLESDFARLKNAFKGATKRLVNPRFVEGDLANCGGVAVVVIGEPYSSNTSSDLLQDVLLDGQVHAREEKTLRKRLLKCS
jgi:hypothetical protein